MNGVGANMSVTSLRSETLKGCFSAPMSAAERATLVLLGIGALLGLMLAFSAGGAQP